ncbi:MAG: glycosyltransferase [Candidatus Omnitrophica bacterium]|nr:glycosyltransferase [Candidatus Omnitrophota bacterium]
MKKLSEEKKDKKKHLLFFIPSLRYGGAERVVVNLSRALVDSGRYRVSILLLEGSADYPISDDIEVTRLYYGKRDIFSKTRSLIYDPFILKDFVENNDVDIVLSFMQRPNVINLMAKAFGAKHSPCVNVRVCLTKQYENIPRLFKFICRIALERLWRYAEVTFVNSYVIKDEIVTYFKVERNAINVVYNPLYIKEIEHFAKEEVEEEWFKQKDIPVVINVGRLTKQKGHIYLLRATARIAAKRPIRLAIIGDGELKEKLIRESKRLRIYDRVLFMGWQKNPYKYIMRSNVFVLSSLWEGFPNAVLESMACRCPVIVNNCPSGPSEMLLPERQEMDDIVESKYGILINKLSISNLSDAIERILDNKDLFKKYADAGIERASQFDLLPIAKNYEECLLKSLKDYRKEQHVF